jgi:hypothetical protein
VVKGGTNQSKLPPNKPMQLTPLRVPKIIAFLKRRIGSGVISIYRWRRN